MKTIDKRVAGFIMAIGAATLWGISGAFAQFLFQEKQITPEWLVTVRLITAGSLLLLLAAARKNIDLGQIWRHPKDRRSLVLFSIFGMLAVQYTYFAAIASSNAATATVIQYTGPVFIMLYMAVSTHKWPSGFDYLAILMALAGIFLLVTQGRTDKLSLSGIALFWGIASAITLAIHSIQPVRLLNKYPSMVLVGWAMLIGGGAFIMVSNPLHVPGIWDLQTAGGILFIILFGTLIPFYAYLNAVKILGPQTSGLLACAEPVSAAVVAVYWLKVPFGFTDWAGAFLIVGTILVIALQERKTVQA